MCNRRFKEKAEREVGKDESKASGGGGGVEKSKQLLETLNAFHLISLLEGFDLSPLFKEKKRMEKEDDLSHYIHALPP
ncbi:unnamed protein product [Linum trigynum]|uniref:NAF domain-containing protein n=1 Tax=Linum trigynum TaxID=586398 RepID=A0AAV2DTW0_9ROSI